MCSIAKRLDNPRDEFFIAKIVLKFIHFPWSTHGLSKSSNCLLPGKQLLHFGFADQYTSLALSNLNSKHDYICFEFVSLAIHITDMGSGMSV